MHPFPPKKSLLGYASTLHSLIHTYVYRQAQRESVKKTKTKDEASDESTESSSEDEKPAAKHPLLTNGKVRIAIYLLLQPD